MKAVAAVVLLLAVAVAAEIALPEADMQALFTSYMTRFNKVYAKEEFFGRYNVFKANYLKVLQHNAGRKHEDDAVMGMTSLTDLSPAEYKKMLGFKMPAALTPKHLHSKHMKLNPVNEGIEDATPINWIEKGAVNAIQDQGQCGSCWAFSTVAAAESAMFQAGNALPKLSEQQLVDCSTKNQGCQGGLMHLGMEFIIANKGLCSEKEYPYTSGPSGETGTCNTKKCTSAEIPLKSYVNVTCDAPNFCDRPYPARNESSIYSFLVDGVISVAIEADQSVFQNYKGGVIKSKHCGTQLDHGVDIVGFNVTAAGIPYWIVRNSWGTVWGDPEVNPGYVNIEAGKNVCGISQYSILASA